MGNFYSNITVKGASGRKLRDLLSSRSQVSYVASPSRSLHIVFHETEDAELAADISRSLGCVTLYVNNADDDSLHLALHREGELLASYESLPHDMTGTGQSAESASSLARVFRSRQQLVQQILEDRYDFETVRHAALVEALRLSPLAVGAGFRDIEAGEVPWADEVTVRLTPSSDAPKLWPPLPAVDENDLRLGREFFRDVTQLHPFSLRGMLCLATRSGRRMQWLDAVQSPGARSRKQAGRIETAIVAAETVCHATRTQNLCDRLAMACFALATDANASVGGAYNPEEWAEQPQVTRAAFLIADAGLQVAGVDHTLEWLAPGSEARVKPNEVVYIEWMREVGIEPELQKALSDSLSAIQAGIPSYRDIERLRTLGTGHYREYGAPIDPTDAGPLGAYWSE